MYTGTNPAALRSRDEIVQAFLTLLENTSLENMAVKQLMEATDLSRQTFYQIFNSKEEILEYYFDTIFSHFIIDFITYAMQRKFSLLFLKNTNLLLNLLYKMVRVVLYSVNAGNI